MIRRVRPESGAHGFTLIEVLVVVTLIVVLASIGVALYSTSVVRSREAVLREDLFQMRDALDQYQADKGRYPPSLQALVGAGYIRRVPVDPFTESAETWLLIPQPYDPDDPSAEIGIYNIFSGSPATALDGSSYRDW